jgi:hypothetical protein
MTATQNSGQPYKAHPLTAWLGQAGPYRAIAVLLVLAPLTLFFIDPYFFLADPLLLFVCATIISAVIGINRFTQWKRNPLIDLSGCIIAFVLCALAAVHILLLVGAISFVVGGGSEPAPEDKFRAYVFSFYTAVTLIGAIQASVRSKLRDPGSSNPKL